MSTGEVQVMAGIAFLRGGKGLLDSRRRIPQETAGTGDGTGVADDAR